MITFVVSLVLLVLGYLLYGRLVEKIFCPDPERTTPGYKQRDGVDYLPMSTWRVFLIQFLNIAGTGPIFGAILGIMFGPAAYLWIVLGCIFGGAVHDYLTGMISIRKNGASLPEIVGDELGNVARIALRVLSLILLVLVGAVFARTPADLIAGMTPDGWGMFNTGLFWLIIIVVYYILATLLPIDKLIGRIYPLFGLALLIMAVGICYGIFAYGQGIPEITEAFTNHHPSAESLPLFPCICTTIACGAVSGFHSTQSPLMARCIENEKYGRKVFYGAMITEGIVALIWAAGAIAFANSFDAAGATPYEKLLNIMTENGAHSANPAVLVDLVCKSWLGVVGSILAVLGVVAAPITSGDTAFRSARLIISDFLHLKQEKILNRLVLAIPIFVFAIALFFIDFQVLWRYFAWFNQTLACVALWTFAVWLSKQKKNFYICLVPALFMSLVSVTYICIAPEGFELPYTLSYCIGGIVTCGLLIWFIVWQNRLGSR